MNRWLKGLLIGVGVGIVSTVIVLVLRGEKPRRFLQARLQQVLVVLPEREQVQRYAQQATTRVSQIADSAKGTVLETMKKVKRSESDVGEIAIPLTPVES